MDPLNLDYEINSSYPVSKSRKVWSHAETVALLDAYELRKDEFTHTRRKKYAWQNVAEDLGCGTIVMEPVNAVMCENKMKSLLRAYKEAKDNSNRTGAGRTYVPFEKQLDELFGNRPIVGHAHSLSLSGEPTTALPTSSKEEKLLDVSMQSGSRNKRSEYLDIKLKLRKDLEKN